MGLMPGYKQTDVGVIPEDWAVRELSQITKSDRPISYGIVQTGRYIENGVMCIRVVDISDGKVNSANLIRTSEEISASYRRTILEAGDLVIALRGKIGELAVIDEDLAGTNLTRGVALIALTSDYDPVYLRQYLSSLNGKSTLEKNLNGSALQEIPIGTLRGIPVALPPLPEQRAISAVLSDVDALIGALARLIAKKRAIKKGIMQQLLTGKKRLPGFSGEWEVKDLSKLLTQPATYGIVKAGAFQTQGIPMVRGGDIKDATISLDLPFVTKEKSAEYTRTVIQQGDVVIALVGYPGESAKVPKSLEGANISRAVGLLRPGKRISPDYLVCYLNSPAGRRNFLTPSAGSAQLVVNLKDLNRLQIPLPSPVEQEAIATILFDMDAEITALERRSDKTHLLKQGMMHELLTGRIRLVGGRNEELLPSHVR